MKINLRVFSSKSDLGKERPTYLYHGNQFQQISTDGLVPVQADQIKEKKIELLIGLPGIKTYHIHTIRLNRSELNQLVKQKISFIKDRYPNFLINAFSSHAEHCDLIISMIDPELIQKLQKEFPNQHIKWVPLITRSAMTYYRCCQSSTTIDSMQVEFSNELLRCQKSGDKIALSYLPLSQKHPLHEDQINSFLRHYHIKPLARRINHEKSQNNDFFHKLQNTKVLSRSIRHISFRYPERRTKFMKISFIAALIISLVLHVSAGIYLLQKESQLQNQRNRIKTAISRLQKENKSIKVISDELNQLSAYRSLYQSIEKHHISPAMILRSISKDFKQDSWLNQVHISRNSLQVSFHSADKELSESLANKIVQKFGRLLSESKTTELIDQTKLYNTQLKIQLNDKSF